MNMNWSNSKYILRAGVLNILLLIPCLASAICGTDTIIKNYKPDSVRIVIKSDSVIAYHTGDSLFTILQADSVISNTKESIGHTRYDKRVHRMRKNWECIIPTHSKIQFAGNMGLLSFLSLIHI